MCERWKSLQPLELHDPENARCSERKLLGAIDQGGGDARRTVLIAIHREGLPHPVEEDSDSKSDGAFPPLPSRAFNTELLKPGV